MSTSLIGISQEPGVKDLPTTVRKYFAMAIKKEREGDSKGAERWLDKAVAAEE